MKRKILVSLSILTLFSLSFGLSLTAMAQEAPPAEKPKMKTRSIYKVNINKASRAELMGFALIGPIVADRIIKGRPYKSIEDLLKIEGMDEDMYASIKGEISTTDPKIEEEKQKVF